MTLRDFTSECKENLLNLCQEVEDDNWCAATDAVGDFFGGIADALGFCEVSDYVNNMDDYYYGVIDRNDAAVEEIENIFSNVYTVDDVYASKFTALKSSLDTYKSSIDMLAQAIDPANDSFNLPAMSALTSTLDANAMTSLALLQVAGEGLSETDIANMDPNTMNSMLNGMLTGYLATHTIDGEGRIILGIIPGGFVYLDVDVSGDITAGGSSVSAEIDEQARRISSISGTGRVGDNGSVTVSTDGSGSVSVGSQYSRVNAGFGPNGYTFGPSFSVWGTTWSVGANSQGGYTMSTSGSVGDNVSYSGSLSVNLATLSVSGNETYSFDVNNGNVTFTIGFQSNARPALAVATAAFGTQAAYYAGQLVWPYLQSAGEAFSEGWQTISEIGEGVLSGEIEFNTCPIFVIGFEQMYETMRDADRYTYSEGEEPPQLQSL